MYERGGGVVCLSVCLSSVSCFCGSQMIVIRRHDRSEAVL